MEKIRVSVYWKVGKDEAGNQLISYLRDDLAEIKLGVLEKEEDIEVEIIEISKGTSYERGYLRPMIPASAGLYPFLETISIMNAWPC